ncbi:DUF895 domain membrane protein [Podochytrium sp. JEL0797]|nr:DUF895 domain membrane protein [Podochytrium sp. JEL0797]
MTLFFPCFFSNWCYGYEFGPLGAYFTGRTNSLKAVLYWAAQCLGSWILGNMILDNPNYPRTKRAWHGFCVLVVLTIFKFGGGAAFEYTAVRNGWALSPLDVAHPEALFYPLLLCVCNGIHDAFFQVFTYYLIGAISNESEKLSRYAGFYKGVQSAGNGIWWVSTGFVFTREKGNALDSTTQFWMMTVPCVVSLLFWGIFIGFYVEDTTREDRRNMRGVLIRREVDVAKAGLIDA